MKNKNLCIGELNLCDTVGCLRCNKRGRDLLCSVAVHYLDSKPAVKLQIS